jgi:hypothetical protein
MESDAHQEWLASWRPRPIEERTFAPATIAPWICPQCAGPATIGVRVGGLVNVRCEADGTWYAVAPFSFNQRELLVTAPRPPQMNPEARSWFLHTAAKVMLNAAPGAFLVIELQGHPCEYAIVDRAPDHGIGLQIGSREWDCPHCGNQPILGDATDILTSLGFAPPGPRLNAWHQSLPSASRDFAILLERSFLAAYEPPDDFEVASTQAGSRTTRGLSARFRRNPRSI